MSPLLGVSCVSLNTRMFSTVDRWTPPAAADDNLPYRSGERQRNESEKTCIVTGEVDLVHTSGDPMEVRILTPLPKCPRDTPTTRITTIRGEVTQVLPAHHYRKITTGIHQGANIPEFELRLRYTVG